jgi:putative flippase GtrA
VLVGGAAFLMDVAIVWCLKSLHVSAYGARVISLAASVLLTFFLNRSLTFQAKGPLQPQDFLAYATASGVGVAINYILYAVGIKLGAPLLLAMAVGTLCAALFNFFTYGRIFRSKNR